MKTISRIKNKIKNAFCKITYNIARTKIQLIAIKKKNGVFGGFCQCDELVCLWIVCLEHL